MWIKKTEEEIENTKNQDEFVAGIKVTPFKTGVFIFIFVFVFNIVWDMVVGKSKGRFYLPTEYVREKVTWSKLPDMLPHYFVFSSVLGIMIYIIARKLKGYKMYPETCICQKCSKVKSDDKIYKCDCGGEFIEIDKMKWVEDEK